MKNNYEKFENLKGSILKAVLSDSRRMVMLVDDELRGVGKSEFSYTLADALLAKYENVLLIGGKYENKWMRLHCKSHMNPQAIIVDDVSEEVLETIKQRYPEANIYGFARA